MKDIFDHAVLCSQCTHPMKDDFVSKNGFHLRVKKCNACREQLIHPQDLSEYEEFIRLKKKDYAVKMRMVGNSYAVSIPREIVDFMEDHKRMIDNMVRLSFENAGRLSLNFNTPEFEEDNAHTVSASEVKVVENGKTTYHKKQFRDSKYPQRNRTIVKKEKKEQRIAENDE